MPAAPADAKARRAAQAARYAPKPRAESPRKNVTVEAPAQLRKLTSRVLDELKIPGTVPSQVILAALLEVHAQRPRKAD